MSGNNGNLWRHMKKLFGNATPQPFSVNGAAAAEQEEDRVS